jgi:hypothetical protein
VGRSSIGSVLGKKIGEKLHQKLSQEMRWATRRSYIRSFPREGKGREAPSGEFQGRMSGRSSIRTFPEGEVKLHREPFGEKLGGELHQKLLEWMERRNAPTLLPEVSNQNRTRANIRLLPIILVRPPSIHLVPIILVESKA